MDDLWDLIADNDSVGGKLVTTAVIVGVAIVVAQLGGRLAAHRAEDRYRAYYVRKGTGYVIATVAAIALGILWRPFAGQLGLVLGLITAGVAFAMQELIGALAGWFNIVSGSIFRVGDRVQLGGVRGDVIDVTPLRTKVMEIGSGTDPDAWVRGRQYTGRVVAVSNKMTFTEPVFNYSAGFDFIWEEITLPIAYGQDWHGAEAIIVEELAELSSTDSAREAIRAMSRHYPVARIEVEHRVFLRATDNYLELAARFVVPVRNARIAKDELTRRILARFEAAGITIASQTLDVTMRNASGAAPPPPADQSPPPAAPV